MKTSTWLVMGGGAFCAETLTEAWGDDVAGQFAGERKGIEKKLALWIPTPPRGEWTRWLK